MLSSLFHSCYFELNKAFDSGQSTLYVSIVLSVVNVKMAQFYNAKADNLLPVTNHHQPLLRWY